MAAGSPVKATGLSDAGITQPGAERSCGFSFAGRGTSADTSAEALAKAEAFAGRGRPAYMDSG